ncbi:hypothetical protein ACLOJK_020194 [Asimina triloba]
MPINPGNIRSHHGCLITIAIQSPSMAAIHVGSAPNGNQVALGDNDVKTLVVNVMLINATKSVIKQHAYATVTVGPQQSFDCISRGDSMSLVFSAAGVTVGSLVDLLAHACVLLELFHPATKDEAGACEGCLVENMRKADNGY